VLSSGTAGPTASETIPSQGLANTGAPVGKVLLIAVFVAALTLAVYMIRWCIPSSKNRGNHE